MNWQETTKELKGEGVVAMDMARELLKLQAQASFKAGYEEGRKGCPALEVQGQIYLEGKEAGMREVAQEIFEEIENHLVSGPFRFSSEGKWVECAWYAELKAKYQEGQSILVNDRTPFIDPEHNDRILRERE